MNRWVILAALAVLLSAAGLSPARAAERTTDALLACADESDDAERLRCFDAVVVSLRKAPAPVAPAAAVAAAPAPAAPAPTAEQKFGARGDIKPDKHEVLSELTGTVTALGTKPRGELIVTLDNGQVWAEITTSSKIKLKTGDTVKIERGALGSYSLVAPNGRSSKVSRIR
jgi:biotin carboxyl carrier protein